MSHVLAIDEGTTGVRALIFDQSSAQVGGAYQELTPSYPQPGWFELDAEAIWTATRLAGRVVLGHHRQLVGVEAHRWGGACDRLFERLMHDAVRRLAGRVGSTRADRVEHPGGNVSRHSVVERGVRPHDARRVRRRG